MASELSRLSKIESKAAASKKSAEEAKKLASATMRQANAKLAEAERQLLDVDGRVTDARKAGARAGAQAERTRFKEHHAEEIQHHVNLELAKLTITPSKLGLAHERRLAEILQEHFPQYRVERHGQRADIHLVLEHEGVEIGRIVAEERRQKRISERDVFDANFGAGKARNASFKVLVTTATELTIARKTRPFGDYHQLHGVHIISVTCAPLFYELLVAVIEREAELEGAAKMPELAGTLWRYMQSPAWRGAVDAMRVRFETDRLRLRADMEFAAKSFEERGRSLMAWFHDLGHIERALKEIFAGRSGPAYQMPRNLPALYGPQLGLGKYAALPSPAQPPRRKRSLEKTTR